MKEPDVLIRVHYVGDSFTDNFFLERDPDRWGWKVDDERQLLIIRTKPGRRRCEIPLGNVRYYEVLTRDCSAPAVDRIPCTSCPPDGRVRACEVHGVGADPDWWADEGVEVGGTGSGPEIFGRIRFGPSHDRPHDHSFDWFYLVYPEAPGCVGTAKFEFGDHGVVYGLLPAREYGEREVGALGGSGDEPSPLRDEVRDHERTTDWRPGDC